MESKSLLCSHLVGFLQIQNQFKIVSQKSQSCRIRRERQELLSMSYMSRTPSSACWKSRAFWAGAIYALLLCLDLDSVVFLASDRESDISSYQSETLVEDFVDLVTEFSGPVSRTSQASQFSHPKRITKIFGPIEPPPFLILIPRIVFREHSHLAQIPWYLKQASSPHSRLSGWKDGNTIFKSLSLARA